MHLKSRPDNLLGQLFVGVFTILSSIYLIKICVNLCVSVDSYPNQRAASLAQ